MEHILIDARPDPVSLHALRILEQFAETAHVSFDRLRARRALDEVERAIPGNDSQSWARRLVEIGESMDLRVREATCSLEDALIFVRRGLPLVIIQDRPQQPPTCLLLLRGRGSKVCLAALEEGPSPRLVSVRWLVRALGLTSAQEPIHAIVGQPAFPCAALSAGGADSSTHRHLSPFARLVALLRPELRDLWAVLVFSIVVGLLSLASPIAVEALVNTVAFGRFLQPVVVLAFLLLTFLGFSSGLRALLAYMAEIVQRRLFVRVVEDLAYRLPRVRREAFDHVHGPELLNRFFEVVTVQKVVASLLLDLLTLILQALVGMVVLAFYHPFLLGFDLLMLAHIAVTIFVLGRGSVKTAIDESKAKYAVADWLQELARHATAFKMQAGYQFALDRADQLAVEYLDARKRHFRVLMRQILFSLALQALAATTLLGLGGWLVIGGQLTLGQLVAAELIVSAIVGSFAKLGKHLEGFYDLMASMDKLGHLFDLPTERHDKLFHLRQGEPAAVAIHSVSFAYASNRQVLRDFSLNLQPGERVSLAGPPGTGKSTLFDLLCGLRQPESGHLELDGIDLRELRPDSLREHLALARTVEIFSGTIDENVHLQRPHVTAADVREALSAVGLADEILQLPEGLNTILQPSGSPLTGSQAVRLMLARAIVGRPRLLLVDGLLDGLPDTVLPDVIEHLTRPSTPWSLLVISGRREVLDRCQRVVRLPTGDSEQGASVPGVSG